MDRNVWIKSCHLMLNYKINGFKAALPVCALAYSRAIKGKTYVVAATSDPCSTVMVVGVLNSNEGVDHTIRS